jgi:bifunctional DNase/RNase
MPGTALAVRVGTPILVEEPVLGKAGLGLDDEENWKPAPLSGQVRPRVNKQVSKEDIDRMSAYSDFLNTLNLDDLGKRRS